MLEMFQYCDLVTIWRNLQVMQRVGMAAISTGLWPGSQKWP